VIVYVGHDAFMDFQVQPIAGTRRDKSPRTIILACASRPYFASYIQQTGAEPLLWTTGLMAPEAYTLKAALDGWIAQEDDEAIRLRQPLILSYVLAWLILSPFTPGLRVHDVHTFETMAEIGVILLMFSVGIEFSIPDLLRVKWVALAGAPLGILLSIALGAAAGLLMGWPLLQGIAVGSIVCVASTMVMMRLLMDRGELASESVSVMITRSLVDARPMCI